MFSEHVVPRALMSHGGGNSSHEQVWNVFVIIDVVAGQQGSFCIVWGHVALDIDVATW